MKLLACILLLFTSSVFAQQNLVLNSMVHDQNGTYQIVEEDSVVPFSGAAIQVFKPGERILLDGTTLNTTFIFGQFYAQDGTFFIFQGIESDQRNVPLTLAVTDFELGAIIVGEGVLYFDEERNGNAKDLRLVVSFETEAYEYNLTAQSDRVVFGCTLSIQFSPINPTQYFCPQ